MKNTYIKDIQFKVGIAKNNNGDFTPFSGYELLRMACYPLDNDTGNEDKIIQLHIFYNKKLFDVVEQKQVGITSLKKIDLNLVKYYCNLIGCNADEIEESEKEEWIIVELKIVAYEKL